MREEPTFPDQVPGDGNAGNDQAPVEVGGDLQDFVDHFRRHRTHRAEWVRGSDLLGGADADFAFVAGHQWTEEDTQLLNEQGRPAITFNRTAAYIDSVSGLEVNNRQEVRFIPRTVGRAGVDELATAAAKWARDGCDAEDEESGAFRDTLVCGEGWTQTTLTYDDDPDGTILIQQIDPRAVYPDPASSRANYADMRRVFYLRTMPREDAEVMFPDVDADSLDAAWARDDAERGGDPVDRRAAAFYRDGMGGSTDTDDITIVECEWYEYKTVHRVLHPVTRQVMHLEPADFRKLAAEVSDAGGSLPSTKDRKKAFYRAILGGIVLSSGAGPAQGGFTLKAITGKRDAKKHCWFGLIRSMRDPQMWSNKFLSQYLHIININAKGGLLAEEDAFANKNEAQDTWADPGAITWVRPGGLGKVQAKDPPQFPQGVQFLLQYAISSISDVAGSNPEMMGQADREQAGVVEEHRKQSAMTIYAGMFSSLRRYRKEQGRLLLWLIQTFIADSRLIRIGGADDAQFVPLIRDQMLGEYDIVVDDTPTSPNMKERVWGALLNVFPILKDLNLPPQAMLEMMKYSPLPATLVAKVGGMLPPPQQGPSPMQQAELQLHQAKAQQAQAGAALAQATAQHKQAEAQFIPADLAEKQARIELLRAQAMQALGAVGLAQDDQRFQQAMASIDALVGVAGAHVDAGAAAHQQAMGTVQQAAAVQDQLHGQGMAQQQQDLAQQQADQPPTPPQGATQP